ncbi:MAG: hypothetical protein COA90_00550 [Gammaproteobacteria bacterium]|nr:MAG: hypothetical protein COA90_00550 [Gammaproteobacteria bacterium]
MTINSKGTFIYTFLTSGIVYLLAYLLTTSHYSDQAAAASLSVGFCVYLIIRKIYKQEQGLDTLLAKAYRLIIWLVPILLITAQLILFFVNPGDEPQFTAFYTADDLLWSGPLVIALWPILNMFVLLENIFTFLWMLVYYLGTPVFIVLIILALLALVTVFKKLIRLKAESVIQFSLTLASSYVLTPIIAYTFCIYLWY